MIGAVRDPRDGGFAQGPAEHWVEDAAAARRRGRHRHLHPHGTDDPATLRPFAQEVIPALREAVAQERGPDAVAPDAADALRCAGKRRDGHRLRRAARQSLADAAIEPGDVALRAGALDLPARRLARPGAAGRITPPRSSTRWPSPGRSDVPLAVRSGGHGISGRSTNDGGIVIDLSRLNTIEVLDQATRRVRIGPGARWMDVAAALAPYGWALSSGDYGGVGVGGLATAGGIGWLAREHGLTIDHLRAVEMVLADGSVVRGQRDGEPRPVLGGPRRRRELRHRHLVRVRGGRGRRRRLGPARLRRQRHRRLPANAGARAVEAAPRDLTSFLIMGRPRPRQPMVAQLMAHGRLRRPGHHHRPAAAARRRSRRCYDQIVIITSYAAVMANASSAGHNGQGEPVARSGLIEHITPEFAAAAARLLAQRRRLLLPDPLGRRRGRRRDPRRDTAYGHRSANFSVDGVRARTGPGSISAGTSCSRTSTAST